MKPIAHRVKIQKIYKKIEGDEFVEIKKRITMSARKKKVFNTTDFDQTQCVYNSFANCTFCVHMQTVHFLFMF